MSCSSDLDTTFTIFHEVVVILLRLVRRDVVEQQVVAVAGVRRWCASPGNRP
jgi:hypothetical protein